PSGLELKSLLSSQYWYHLPSTSAGLYLLANSIVYNVFMYFFLGLAKLHKKGYICRSLGQLNYGKYLCVLGKFRSVGQASHCSSFPM
ncbi:MAG TPA: hypothetical protein DCE73_03725, partial [Paraprevotella xylaniphila]|nr:hypothetical protein [Paraprevotella xylaniphila]